MGSSRMTLKKRSIIPTPIVQYKSTLNYYKQFLSSFQSRMQTIIQKQSYRIYLEDKVNEKKFKQLMKEQEQLLVDIQNSKDYTLSMNRGLIQEILNLEKLKKQYSQVFQNYSSKINDNKGKIQQMKKQVKQLQKNIKAYWIYDYNLVSVQQKQNCEKSLSDINSALSDSDKLTPSLFPCLKKKQINTFKCEDKSFVNQSKNKEKIINRIKNQNSQFINQKIQYERQKTILLKLFNLNLKQLFSQEVDNQQKYKMLRIMEEIKDQISIKQRLLDQLVKIVS